MATKQEKECMGLFKYGYFDTVLSGRCSLSLDKVRELRALYALWQTKKDVKKEK